MRIFLNRTLLTVAIGLLCFSATAQKSDVPKGWHMMDPKTMDIMASAWIEPTNS
jgi:hypothetical protein